MMNLLEHESLKTDSRVLIMGQVGSKAYGTSTPESDDDYMGVVCAPYSCYAGLDNWNNDGTLELKRAEGEVIDASIYDIQKFFKLCLAFNPNVIPLLYLHPSDYQYLSESGKLILQHRRMFESKRALNTFVGYANAQLSNVKKGITGKYGEKRKALIQQYGYDVKFAYHTMRLLGMIEEFFNGCGMNVYRKQQIPLLMEIRRGKYTQEEFFAMAYNHMAHVEDAFKRATWLPDEPNYKLANEICIRVIDENRF